MSCLGTLKTKCKTSLWRVLNKWFFNFFYCFANMFILCGLLWLTHIFFFSSLLFLLYFFHYHLTPLYSPPHCNPHTMCPCPWVLFPFCSTLPPSNPHPELSACSLWVSVSILLQQVILLDIFTSNSTGSSFGCTFFTSAQWLFSNWYLNLMVKQISLFILPELSSCY